MKHAGSMGDDGVAARLCSIKTLLGLVAGAGASYGIYKLMWGSGDKAVMAPQQERSRESGVRGAEVPEQGPSERDPAGSAMLQPGSLLAKVSGLALLNGSDRGELSTSSGPLEPHHIKKLLSLLQMDACASDRTQVLVTLGNAAAFSVNQDLIRELDGLHIIAGLLSDPSPEIRVQTLNVLNNLSMNVRNQEHLKVYVSHVLDLIEMSPVNSELQLACLRLLTNLSVTNCHQHLMRNSVTLFLSLLVVSNESLQTQVSKVLVNLSANPDLIEDIMQAQAPASLVLLFDSSTHPGVLLRLLTFVRNLKGWRFLDQAVASHRGKDSVYHILLAEGSPLQARLPPLLTHPDAEIKAQVACLLT
ncbi:armadillo repeat-containing protein 10 [Paramormyrops kingsleyae]|uniref:armadillo repeat-containing protein 10 n=1 Tax=Paramormyrops kingsleyae TaxID=1676925 RepID=UPI003B96F5C3